MSVDFSYKKVLIIITTFLVIYIVTELMEIAESKVSNRSGPLIGI